MNTPVQIVLEDRQNVSGDQNATYRKPPTGRKARLREISGFVLISVGVAGLLVPVIPGIPLIAAGVSVLGSDHSFVRRWRTRLEEKGMLKPEQATAQAPGARTPAPANSPEHS